IQGQTHTESNFLHALSNFNKLLYSNNEVTQGNRNSLSLCHFTINRDSRATEMTNCGFSAPIVVDMQGNVNEWTEGTFAIGWFDNIDLCAEEKMTHSLAYLYAATDGLEDHANDIEVNAWSLFHFLTKNRNEKKSVERILSKARDDILAVRYQLKKDEDENAASLPQIIFHNEYPGSAIQQVDSIQKTFVESMKLALGKSFDSRRHDIILCVREAMINALKHGCQSSPDCSATLTAFYLEKENALGVIINDPGSGHDFDISNRKADLETDMPGDAHLGLVMMSELPDDISTERNGSYVRMVFSLKSDQQASTSHFLPASFLNQSSPIHLSS
ncbi:MAG: ATP-binding protein, partial [Verrucomicrobiota bacterium]